MIFLMLATLFAACTKDRTEDVALTDGMKIYATIADMEGADGRVQLNDKKQTVWNAGDQIMVYGADEWALYEFDGKDGDRSGSFTRLGYYLGAEDMSVYNLLDNLWYALYSDGTPYRPQMVSGYMCFVLDIPHTSTYVKGSYGLTTNVMLGTSSDRVNFTFINLFGYLRVSAVGTKKVKSVEVASLTSETMLSGGFAFVPEIPNASVSLASDETATPSQIIDCGESGVQLSDTPTDFYFAMKPMTIEGGIRVKFTFTDGTSFVKSTEKNIPIARNTIQPMAVLDVDAQEEDPVQFIFIYHTGSVVSAPYLEGVGLDGIIMWGDGNTSLLNEV
ncbi:MAG: hypothetical protein IJ502_06985, partial [Alistipes sp.]|nr:hypothetical protein [Alistipes sp.]